MSGVNLMVIVFWLAVLTLGFALFSRVGTKVCVACAKRIPKKATMCATCRTDQP